MAINRDKVLEAAQKYVEKKKYDRAVVELRKLVEADPNDARTLLKIGDLQAKQGLHADAITTYESVGKLYANQGFALKAIAVYKQIREIIAKHVPQLEERYGHITPKLAELYQQLGLTSDALAALDEVATRLQRQQRDQEAIEVFRRIVELDPTNPLPHLRLAEALSRVKDTEGAVYEFKTAAQQLAGIGRRDDALKVLERLLHHKPDPEQAKICAELYLQRGQPQDGMQALAKLQVCFQANPRDFDTLSLLARAFNAIGQGAKAIEVQKEMARVARDTGKVDLFREILERLMRIAPHDEGVRRLAQQTGSVQAPPPTAGPYGSQPMQAAEPVRAPMPQAPAGPDRGRDYGAAPAYPQQPPAVWGQQGGYQAPGPAPQPPQPSGHPQRPHTQPLQRAGFGSAADPYASAPPIEPESVEEVEEISYSAYEEVEEIEDAQLEQSSYDQVPAQPHAQHPQHAQHQGYADAGYQPQHQLHQQHQQPPAYAHDQHAGYAPDDVPPMSDADSIEQVQKTLADANAFRRVRLYAKALETLRAGLEFDPRSMDLHEVYRDVLIESGETDEAVQEMLVIASLYVDALDGDSAARALQDVLAFDPQNARAIEMLQELGYEIVDENEDLGGVQLEDGGEDLGGVDPNYAHHSQSHAQGHAHGQGHAPLPAYDLDDAAAGQPPAQYVDEDDLGVDQHGGHAHGHGQAHGHHAGYGNAPGADALPSFPLDEPDAAIEYADGDVQGHGHDVHADHDPYASGSAAPGRAPAGATDADELAPPAFGRLSQAPVITTPSIAAAASRELEDALDEAEFFCSRGLFDDAKAILAEQLSKHPNNPLLRERIAEVDAQEIQRGSGARERPRGEPERGGGPDRAFDISASLDALESLDYDEIEPAEGHAAEDQQVDVEEVFAKFKEGVAKQISVEDSDSHYNLGIAYKEMLLLDDAIREFDVAARDPKRECVCRSMIGMIQIERGNINEAIEAFLQGLNSAIKDPSQETVLCYEIGAAYEAKKMNKDALSYYQKAMRRDPNYRDVQERVRRLAKAEPKQNLRQVAVGADDEFDRAFDDLLSKA